MTTSKVAAARCPLPDKTTLPTSTTLALNLQFQLGENPTEPQRVKLRITDGAWELIGLQWPTSIQPGVLVMLTWPTDGTDVIAWTKPLHRPERINGVEYHDEFNRQIVTRELLPNTGRHGAVQAMPAHSWVMRTLQVLGYLCPEGTATLAEDTLIRNCISLGMPNTMTNQIPTTVTMLIAERKIRRVYGSRNEYGELSYPARPGEQPVELLRYLPSVQMLDPKPLNAANLPDVRGAHKVHGFLRRLPDGAHASDAQLELYHDAVTAAEIANRPIDPSRYTFVATHRRGATAVPKKASRNEAR